MKSALPRALLFLSVSVCASPCCLAQHFSLGDLQRAADRSQMEADKARAEYASAFTLAPVASMATPPTTAPVNAIVSESSADVGRLLSKRRQEVVSQFKAGPVGISLTNKIAEATDPAAIESAKTKMNKEAAQATESDAEFKALKKRYESATRAASDKKAAGRQPQPKEETIIPREIGDVGVFDHAIMTAVQVVDSQNLLAKWGKDRYWFSGFDTVGLTDGREFKTLVPVRFARTKTYETAAGTMSTVMVIEPAASAPTTLPTHR